MKASPSSKKLNSIYQKEYNRSITDPELFWKEKAEALPWFEFPKEIITPLDNGHSAWFTGGKMNTCYMALDHHVANGRADQTAILYDSPVTDTKRQFTYGELLNLVSRLAGALVKEGVEKGDRVVIYMPAVPEAIMAMLACARVGAIHSVVFGGFAPKELAMRIDDAQPKVIISASCGVEVTKVIPYQPLLNQALSLAKHEVGKVIMLEREQAKVDFSHPKYMSFNEVISESEPVECVKVDANDPLYILYTSGTTGKPKGIVRANGGHAVALHYSMKSVYGLEPGEVFWAASDVGWVVGHSYIVYAPLIYGATTVMYEGKPIKTPDASAFWRVIEAYKVNVMFTAPTAIRAIRKCDADAELMNQFDLSSLRLQFLAGERCDVATFNWLQEKLGIPVIDHWWQTESGWAMVANMAGYGVQDTKPGSVSFPVCGYDLRILNEAGEEVLPGEEGYVAVKLPLPPSCLATIWRNDKRFIAGYLSKFKDFYFSGDGGYKDEDGYVFITGRIDDVINVAGHRLSTAEIEEVVASHPQVAECAVVGMNDELRGQIPLAFVVVKHPEEQSKIIDEVILSVRNSVGAIAYLKRVIAVDRLPKTRSGKTLRKTLKSIVNGEEYTVPSTIDDPQIVNEIEKAVKL